MTRCSRWLAVTMILSGLPSAGCTGKNAAQERDHADINAIATVYRSYAQIHGGPPPNEQVLRKFIESLPGEKRKALKAEDIDAIFISPRDRQPYVVCYGEATKGLIPDYYIYEKEGFEGKRWVACSMGFVSEMDRAEIDKRVGGKP